MKTGKVRLSLDVSPELYETLEQLANKTHGSKSDVLRKAIVLMEVAVEAKERHQKLGLLDENRQVVSDIIGY